MKAYLGPKGAVSVDPARETEVHLAAGLEDYTRVLIWNAEGTVRYRISLKRLRALVADAKVETEQPSTVIVRDAGRRYDLVEEVRPPGTL